MQAFRRCHLAPLEKHFAEITVTIKKLCEIEVYHTMIVIHPPFQFYDELVRATSPRVAIPPMLPTIHCAAVSANESYFVLFSLTVTNRQLFQN